MNKAVGIDIGTGSIRRYHDNNITSIPITTTHGEKFITQSSLEIYSKLLQLLHNSDFQIESISICATCSQVVLQKIIIDDETYLTPYNLNPEIPGSDVLLWMDNSPISQCEELNQSVDPEVLQQIGGKFIPELGLPKLKMLNDGISFSVELVVFELYDFMSYLLKYSYTEINGTKVIPYVKPEKFKSGYAIDGSVKGWSTLILEKLNIHIEVGRSEVSGDRLLPIGYPVGTVHNSNIVIAHGCIDCYGGWFNNFQLSVSNSVSMVAGTSTCFIYNSTTSEFIPNTWGPYEFSEPGIFIYEFGQPATGKLYELILGKDFDFEKAELEIVNLEKKHGKSIHELVKGYFYYGDVFGNRSPLQDPEMSEMIIDSNNQVLPRILHNDDNDGDNIGVSKLIQYVLILEFLVFQTKQLLEPLGVDKLIIVGSQAKNRRFLRLLNLMTDVDVEIGSDEVARGACLLAKLGKLMSLNNYNYSSAFKDVIKENQSQKVQFEKNVYEINILSKKYEIFKDMINIQRKYRKLMNGY